MICIMFMVLLFSSVTCSAVTIMPVQGLLKIGQNVYIQPGQVENSDVVSVGGDIYVNGTVNGNTVCIGGNIYLNGTVKGDVTCIGGNVNKGDNAKINGKSTEVGNSIKLPFRYRNNYFNNFSRYFRGGGSFASFILLFIFSVIIYEIMPRNITKVAFEAKDNFGKSIAIGYAAFVVTICVAVLLVLTLVGILLVPLLALALYVVFLIGFASIALYCGKRLGLAILNRNISDLWCIFIGAALYELIKSISFAAIGDIVCSLIIIPLCVGIAVYTQFGILKSWKRPNGDGSEWEGFRK